MTTQIIQEIEEYKDELRERYEHSRFAGTVPIEEVYGKLGDADNAIKEIKKTVTKSRDLYGERVLEELSLEEILKALVHRYWKLCTVTAILKGEEFNEDIVKLVYDKFSDVNDAIDFLYEFYELDNEEEDDDDM